MTKNSTPTISRIGSRLNSNDNQVLCFATWVRKVKSLSFWDAVDSASKMSLVDRAGYCVLILELPSDFLSSVNWSVWPLSSMTALLTLPDRTCWSASLVLTPW